MKDAVYIGDAVCAQRDDQGSLWLSTSGHIGSTQENQKICLEREVEDALLKYLGVTRSFTKNAVPVPKLPSDTPVFRHCEYAQTEIANLQKALDWVVENQEKLTTIEVSPNPIGSGYVDFDRLSRDKVLAVIKAFPGKWSKSTCFGRMDYTQVLENGISLRIYGAELPPSCKLVKKLVTIPEHTEERMEVECSTGKEIE